MLRLAEDTIRYNFFPTQISELSSNIKILIKKVSLSVS